MSSVDQAQVPDWEILRRDQGWPTPRAMRSAASALDGLSIPKYGAILRYVADLCESKDVEEHS